MGISERNNHYLIAGLGQSHTRYFIDGKQVDAATYYRSLERHLREKEATCEKCYGRGWYAEVTPETEDDEIPDYKERYCDCAAGKRRRELD